MKLRLLIVILVLAALFSGVVLWRVDRFVYGDRMSFAESQARSQLSALTQAINSEVQSAHRMLSTVNADTFKRERTNWRAFQPYYALALMTTKDGALTITQMTARSDSPAAGWTPVELSQYIGFMGKELDSRGTVLLRAFKDPKKNRHVAVIFAGGGHAYILIGSGGNFQSLIESQRGSMNSFAIIASDGLTISHPIPEYIGTPMGDSTLIKEIRTTGSAQGLGTYRQGKKQVFGMYEQVPGTSAYVISTVAIDELMKGRLSLAWQFVFLVIGIGLVGAGVYFWYEKKNAALAGGDAAAVFADTNTGIPAAAVVANPVTPAAKKSAPPPSAPPKAAAPQKTSAKAMEKPTEKPAEKPVTSEKPKSAPPKNSPPSEKPQLAPPVAEHSPDVVTSNATLVAPVAPKPPPPSAPKSLPVTPPDWQVEKAEAYRQVAAAMGQEMRAPLASILGFSQMVLAKTQDPEVVQAVESILREARSSRDVLEKLVTFSGERNTEKIEVKIEGPLIQALKNLDTRLQQKGVRVEKDFRETSPWPLATTEIVKVFENIFENAIEAMERMQDKVMKVSSWEDAEGLHVRVADSGEGIDAENLMKVFDPFYTTRSYANHVGLGLPVAAGILKEHQAQIKIQSQRAKGTQVDVLFAPRPATQQEIAFEKSAAPMTAMELPSELPKVSAASEEDIAAAMQGTEVPKEKLTDVNVDSLLELPPEDMPLQFLDGQGFQDEEPAPFSAPPQKAAAVEPEHVATKPEVTSSPLQRLEIPAREPEEEIAPFESTFVTSIPTGASVPASSAPTAPPPKAPPSSSPLKPLNTAPTLTQPQPPPPPEPQTSPSVVIDKPPTAAPPNKNSELDSYKVAVRRPGRKN